MTDFLNRLMYINEENLIIMGFNKIKKNFTGQKSYDSIYCNEKLFYR